MVYKGDPALNSRHTDLRQLDGHKYSASDKGYHDEDERKDKLESTIQLWDVTSVGLVQDDEPQCSTCEEEGRRKPLHYVLAVDPVLHKGDRP